MHALKNVDFDVFPGEVVALIGDNGTLDLDKAAGFAVLNIAPMLADVPSMRVFPDVDARDVARSIVSLKRSTPATCVSKNCSCMRVSATANIATPATASPTVIPRKAVFIR